MANRRDPALDPLRTPPCSQWARQFPERVWNSEQRPAGFLRETREGVPFCASVPRRSDLPPARRRGKNLSERAQVVRGRINPATGERNFRATTRSGLTAEDILPDGLRSRRRSELVTRNPSHPLRLWREAAIECGFLQQRGSFRPLPRKGTPEYARIRMVYEAKCRGERLSCDDISDAEAAAFVPSSGQRCAAYYRGRADGGGDGYGADSYGAEDAGYGADDVEYGAEDAGYDR